MRERRSGRLSDSPSFGQSAGRGASDGESGAIRTESVEGLLSERELCLFRRMGPLERGAARIRLRANRRRMAADRDRLRALLLRDVGKGRPGVGQRILVRLAAAAFPRSLADWQQRNDNSYLAQVGRLARYREAGADLLELAGSSPKVIALVRAPESP